MSGEKKKKLLLCGTVLLLFAFGFFQNNRLVVSNYRYHSDAVTTDMEGYTIVQVSDLHNKLFGAGQRKLLRKIEDSHPDMIVVTGDLVDSNRPDIGKAMLFIRGAVQIAPVYYVTGNHELLLEEAEYAELMRKLQDGGVVVLDNARTEIPVGESSFAVIGLGDHSLRGNVLQELVQENDEELTVLLAHEPQYLPDYSRQNVDLVLSGHAHGGQFRLPFVGGLIAPGQGFFPKYAAGAYRDGRTTMIVSRGLGNSVIPLRLFNYPDIVCVRFSAE